MDINSLIQCELVANNIIYAPEKVDWGHIKFSLSELWKGNDFNNKQRMYLSIACLIDCSGRVIKHDTLQNIAEVGNEYESFADMEEYRQILLEIKKTGAVKEKNQLLELITWPRRKQTILPRNYVGKCFEVVGKDFEKIYNKVLSMGETKPSIFKKIISLFSKKK